MGSLIVAVLALLWGVYTYVELRAERRRHAADQRRHEEIIEDLRRRNEAMTQLSGALREIQHCTDDHGGEPSYQERIERTVKAARSLVLQNARLLGEDVIAIVQRETTLAATVFEHQRRGGAEPDELGELQRVRARRVAILDRLGARAEFPPAPGSLQPDG